MVNGVTTTITEKVTMVIIEISATSPITTAEPRIIKQVKTGNTRKRIPK